MASNRPAALIVEDQPFVGLVASDILRELGFETFHAFDADAAAKVLGEHPEIAVMVADADLPGSLSGLELVRRVARERPNLQLVVTSAGKAVPPRTNIGHWRAPSTKTRVSTRTSVGTPSPTMVALASGVPRCQRLTMRG